MAEQDPFAGMKESRGSQIKFGKPGDWFRGTVVRNDRRIANKLSAKGEMQTIYEFKALGGKFHDIVDKVVQPEVTEVVVGEFYSFFAKGFVEAELKKAKIGQIIGLSFTEERAATQPGFNKTKIIKVLMGDMDPDYKGETAGDGFGLDTPAS